MRHIISLILFVIFSIVFSPLYLVLLIKENWQLSLVIGFWTYILLTTT